LFGLSIAAFVISTILCYVIAFALSDGSEEAFVTAEVMKIFVYGLAAVPLIIMAYFVAKKV
jgi:ABC-type phosphate/phosphonate transport system permease subunit